MGTTVWLVARQLSLPTSSETVRLDQLWFGQKGSAGEGGSQPPVHERLWRLYPGPRVVSSLLLSSRWGREGAPAPGACINRGGLSSVCFRRRRTSRAGIQPLVKGARDPRRGRPPTRLETWTKDSNVCTSQRVSLSPHGAMKVKASTHQPR